MKPIVDPSLEMEETKKNGALPIQAKEGARTFYLHPGGIYASPDPVAVTTILGSCVAVCLWDSLRGIGGINHYLLPHWAGEGQSSGRFGNVAMRLLIEKVVGLGGKPRDLQAKLFGGACVIEAMQASGRHLGIQNIDIARKLLEKEEIPVVGEDVGGKKGRKVIFHTDSGITWVKLL